MDMELHHIEDEINIESYLNLTNENHYDTKYITIQKTPQYQQQDDDGRSESEILPHSFDIHSKMHSSTLGSEVASSQKKGSKEATAKYREKRKRYIKDLEEEVRKFEDEITSTEAEIKEVKDLILAKLEASTKAVHNSENAEIFGELESSAKCYGEEELMDVDKINLLLNTLKYRIGPSGRERQAKIDYNFKNIVNTLLPGLHRYFLITAIQNMDIFKTEESSIMIWTKPMLEILKLTPLQINQLKQLLGSKLTSMHQITLDKITYLQSLKKKMREEGFLLDKVEDDFRENMTPMQCVRWILFCEKYKYRKDISLDSKFRPRTEGSQIEDEMEELLYCKLGKKRVKTD